MKKILCSTLILAMLLLLLPVAFAAEAAETSMIQITTNPAGADVYIDGEFSGSVSPCSLLLNPGEHEISCRIPGYQTFSSVIQAEKGQKHELTGKLLPDLPDAVVITVNTEEDLRHDDMSVFDRMTVETLPEKVSLRMAVAAVNNDPSDTAYRIEFADNVHHIVPEPEGGSIWVSRGNLVINGDRDGDGAPDVTISEIPVGSLHILPVHDLYLNGLFFEGYSMAIRPDDNGTEDVLYENIYVLGCTFRMELIAFGGACKSYNSSGATNYRNIYCCGCDLGDSNLFFSYSGNCDNSETDGLYYCANQLTDNGKLSVLTADCNTWYIYGRDSENGNGGTPGAFETSDDNVIRNVLISGNSGGGMVLGAGTNGNSRNILDQVTVRNNFFTDNLHIRPAQQFDDSNEGNTLSTSENVISHLLITRNVIDGMARDYGPFFYTAIVAGIEHDPTSTFIAENNIIQDISFVDNILIYINGQDVWYTAGWLITPGVEYTLDDGIVISVIDIDGTDNATKQTDGNRYEGVLFSKNRKIDNYDPKLPWNQQH